jgi:hypothetical protein
MPFVQALKRLIHTNDQTANVGATTTADNHPSIQADASSSSSHGAANANGSFAQTNNSKTSDSFKPLSQGLQKKYARGVQYNSKSNDRSRTNDRFIFFFSSIPSETSDTWRM